MGGTTAVANVPGLAKAAGRDSGQIRAVGAGRLALAAELDERQSPPGVNGPWPKASRPSALFTACRWRSER